MLFTASLNTNSINENDTTWSVLQNQNKESYIVAEPGFYRRAYITECGTVYSNTIYLAEGSMTNAFYPGEPLDEIVSICAGESLEDNVIGSIPTAATINGEGNAVLNFGTESSPSYHIIYFQWQDSIHGERERGWQNITNATEYQYTIPSNPQESISYRRLITAIQGLCEFDNLNNGVYNVVVKPTFTYTKTVLNGCPREDNASVEFNITSGSGDYDVYYEISENKIYATSMGNGKYKFTNLENDGTASYSFTIEDNVYGCSKTETVEIGAPTQLTIGTIANDQTVVGCQGAQITIPLPGITGGNTPYRIEVESSVLGINREMDANTDTVTIPEDAAAGTHTIIYKVTDASGCYATSTQNILTINANPVLTLSKTNIEDCRNVDGTITATVTNGTSPYTYSIAKEGQDNYPHSDNDGYNYKFSGLSHGTYTITVTDNNECEASASETIDDNLDLTIVTSVTVNGNSIADDNGYNVICPNKAFNVNVTSVNGTSTPIIGGNSNSLYEYSFDNGANFDISHTHNATSQNTCGGEQSFNVVVKELSSGCQDKLSQPVQVIVEDDVDPALTGTWPANITGQDNCFANADISGLLSNDDVKALYSDC